MKPARVDVSIAVRDRQAIARDRIFLLPAQGGPIVRLDGAEESFGVFTGHNPLRDPTALDELAIADRVLMYSGTLAANLFAAHPTTWLAPGHDALARFCAAHREMLRRMNTRVCFVPHSRHVLNDPQSCLTFLEREREIAAQARSASEGQSGNSAEFELALAPQFFLEPSMLGEIDDHLTRAFEVLGGRVAALLLHDCCEGGDGLCHVPLGRGVLPRSHVLALIESHLPARIPIILLDEQVDTQLDWLGV